ncbi:MAG: hypothetical protein ACFFCZ_14415 [Promethearchaeota archaeon]
MLHVHEQDARFATSRPSRDTLVKYIDGKVVYGLSAERREATPREINTATLIQALVLFSSQVIKWVQVWSMKEET